MNPENSEMPSRSATQQNYLLNKVMPAYLIRWRDEKNKIQLFLASSLDENTMSIKAVGIDIKLPEEEVCKDYKEILSKTDKSEFKQISLPWHLVQRVQNLIFRAK